MILLCYDGSADANAAIDAAGELSGGHPVTVLTVWEPLIDIMARTGTGLGFGTSALDFEAVDAASEKVARERADEGVEHARRAGLDPQPRTAPRRSTITETILAEADAIEASAIVLGSRGRTGLKSLLLGSVSHGVLQHAGRPVVVVPSPEVAAERTAHRRTH